MKLDALYKFLKFKKQLIKDTYAFSGYQKTMSIQNAKPSLTLTEKLLISLEMKEKSTRTEGLTVDRLPVKNHDPDGYTYTTGPRILWYIFYFSDCLGTS